MSETRKRVIDEFVTFVFDDGGVEHDVVVRITDYRPGKPERRSYIPENYDPGEPAEVDFELYYADGRSAKDLINAISDEEYWLLYDEALERGEQWYAYINSNIAESYYDKDY